MGFLNHSLEKAGVIGRIVAVLELKDANGVNVIVPFELDVKSNGYHMNLATSVYGRARKNTDDILWYVKNIRDKNTLYINKKKAAEFFHSAGLQLPMEGTKFNDFFGSSIKTEDDLVKLQKSHPTQYSLRKNQDQQEDQERTISPQDIIDAVNDVVKVYEGSKLGKKE